MNSLCSIYIRAQWYDRPELTLYKLLTFRHSQTQTFVRFKFNYDLYFMIDNNL